MDSFVAAPPSVPPGGVATLQVDAHDPDCSGTCTTGCGAYIRSDLTVWTANGGSILSEDNGASQSPYTATAEWQAPATEGTYTVEVFLADSGSTFLCGGRQTTTATVDILVTNNPNQPPVIESLTALPSLLLPTETADLLCVASDPDGDPVSYDWAAVLGTVTPGAQGAAVYTAPTDVVGIDTVTCTATDGQAPSSDTVQISIVGAEAEKALVKALVAPQRLAADSEGNLFVVERRGGGISVLNLFSEELVYRLPLVDVTAVAVDWKDDLLVGGRLGANVFDREGELLLPLDPGGGLGDVSDVAVDRINLRFGVLYRSAGRVVVFDASGAQVTAFGSTGDGPGQFKSPQGLAAAPGGEWLVADSGHGRILRFDAGGNLLASFGDLGGGVGEFVQLDDVAVDAAGIIYASDSFQSWVQVFDPDGTPRETLGGYGEVLGRFKTPTGIAEVKDIGGLSDFDRLVVASLNTSSLQVFRRDKDPLVGPPPSADAAVAPASLDFQDTAVGLTGPPATVTLSNPGTAILGVRGVDVQGPFAVSHDCLAVEAAGWCTATVTFRPRAPGSQTGTLEFVTSAGRLTVPLSGQAFLPADVELRPRALGFSDQEIGTVSEPQPVTLTNPGSVALEILAIEVSAEYLVADDCPASLAGGASCTIEVRFAPESIVENLLGTLTVTSSAAGSPHTVELEGHSMSEIPRFRVSLLQSEVEEGLPSPDSDPVAVQFEISLWPPATRLASVHYETMDGTATAGEDYLPVQERLEFQPGETSRTIEVRILDDGLLEPDSEAFTLELWGPLASLIEDQSTQVSILDDEVCLGPVLVENAGAELLAGASPIPGWAEGPGQSWQIRSLSPGPLEGIAYFAAAPVELAELVQEVDVSSFAGAIDAGGQLLDLSAWIRTAEDDTARVLVEYLNWDRTAVLDQFDSGEIASAGSWRQVTDLRAAPPETRWLRVSLIGRRLTGPANDAFFDAVSLRPVRAATVEVADSSRYEGDVGVANAVVAVRLACPYYQNVLVDLATVDATAVAGEDYQAASAAVLLSVGETEHLVPVGIFGDRLLEGHEEFLVEVQSVEPFDAVRLTERAVGVILDDDRCPSRPSWWLENPGLLPDRMALGGVVYGRDELTGFLAYKGADISLEVARELTAARLNLGLGSPPSILATAEAADVYLAAHPPGSDPDGDAKNQGKALRNTLRQYNKAPCMLGLPLPGAPGAEG